MKKTAGEGLTAEFELCGVFSNEGLWFNSTVTQSLVLIRSHTTVRQLAGRGKVMITTSQEI